MSLSVSDHALGLPVFRDVPRDRAVWRRKDRGSIPARYLGQCRQERGDQHSLRATGGTSDRDGGIAVRLRTTDNYYLVQLDALTNRVLFSLVTHGVPEDRRRRCGYSFAHLV
jgi:hypothetical protein